MIEFDINAISMVAEQLTVIVLLLLIILGGLRRWYVWWPEHQAALAELERQRAELVADRDYWRDLALTQLKINERAVEVSRRGRSER